MNKPAVSIPTAPRTERDLLTALLEFLSARDVAHCVLGDPGELVERIDGDVDLAVDSPTLRRLPNLLSEFGDRHGARLVLVVPHETTALFCVLASTGPAGKLRYLRIDACSDYVRDARRLLASDALLHGRVPPGTDPDVPFYTPRPDAAFLYYLLKKVEKLELDARHGAYLTAQWRRAPQRCRTGIERFWSGPPAADLAGAAASGHWETVRAALPSLRRALRKRRPGTPLRRALDGVRLARRLVRPVGVLVAALGPDGSGKSTVIETLRRRLDRQLWGAAALHFRPRLGGRHASIVKHPVADPHRLPPRSLPGSVLKLFFYVADYLLGYLLRVRPLLARNGVVFFDRYYHDMLVDPRRYRFGGPRWLLRAGRRLVPRPDLFLILDAAPEVLHRRKQEVAFEETTRQRNAYRELAASLDPASLIDASQSLDAVTDAVERAIVDALARKTLARLSGRGRNA